MAILESNGVASTPYGGSSPETEYDDVGPAMTSSADSSDYDSGMESDEPDLTDLIEPGSELCQVGDQTLALPVELYSLTDLTEILSVSTWNDLLTESDRLELSQFLPDMDQETFVHTLTELLEGQNFHFGNPLRDLFEQLKGGQCNPKVVAYRRGLEFLEKGRYYCNLRKYQDSMVSSILGIKDAWENCDNCESYRVEEKIRLLNIIRSQSSLCNESDNESDREVELEMELESEGSDGSMDSGRVRFENDYVNGYARDGSKLRRKKEQMSYDDLIEKDEDFEGYVDSSYYNGKNKGIFGYNPKIKPRKSIPMSNGTGVDHSFAESDDHKSDSFRQDKVIGYKVRVCKKKELENHSIEAEPVQELKKANKRMKKGQKGNCSHDVKSVNKKKRKKGDSSVRVSESVLVKTKRKQRSKTETMGNEVNINYPEGSDEKPAEFEFPVSHETVVWVKKTKQKTGKKRKWKLDSDTNTTVFNEQDPICKAEPSISSPNPPIDESSVTKKKKRKRKLDTGSITVTDSVPVVPPIPPNAIKDEEITVQPDPVKPKKKKFTHITPTIHTDISFSIVHFLSAIRMTMIGRGITVITRSEEDEEVEQSQSTQITVLPSLTVKEIAERVRSNPLDPNILLTEEPLNDLIRGVLRIFSSKSPPLGAKGWKPLVLYDSSNKSWSWIGPNPNPNPNPNRSEEEEMTADMWGLSYKVLVKLVDSFANWLKHGQETLKRIGSLPPPPIQPLANLDERERFKDLKSQKSQATINPSSDEIRTYFRKEELLRYSIPDRAFAYTATDGKKSTVAPLRRGGGGKVTTKARDHFMLRPDRPPHVTILCLVRDAAARLPGSIGTRADVCTLLRDSQYVMEDVPDDKVSEIVSGALDRLHYERDPCVKFDSERKLWSYLHREREEEDFEDGGTESTKKWKKPKKESTEIEAANNVMNDSCNNDNNVNNGERVELVYGDMGGIRPFDELSQVICQENSRNQGFGDAFAGEREILGLVDTSFL